MIMLNYLLKSFDTLCERLDLIVFHCRTDDERDRWMLTH